MLPPFAESVLFPRKTLGRRLTAIGMPMDRVRRSETSLPKCVRWRWGTVRLRRKETYNNPLPEEIAEEMEAAEKRAGQQLELGYLLR